MLPEMLTTLRHRHEAMLAGLVVAVVLLVRTARRVQKKVARRGNRAMWFATSVAGPTAAPVTEQAIAPERVIDESPAPAPEF
jgi:hypothetical protein